MSQTFGLPFLEATLRAAPRWFAALPERLAAPRQIQIASDMWKGCLSRLAGVEAPSWADDEHCTTTYALLRHAGVELGKMDYLGGP